MTKAINAATISKRLRDRLTDGNPYILIGVMVIDVRITACCDLQIDQTMAADLVKHVIEKCHSGIGLALAGAIQIQTHLHIGFTGDPMDRSLTCHHPSFSALIVPHIPVTQ